MEVLGVCVLSVWVYECVLDELIDELGGPENVAEVNMT